MLLRHKRINFCFSITAFLVLFVPRLFPSSGEELKISYILDVTKPQNHLFDVSLRVDNVKNPFLDFSLPAWMPGYSKILNFARNVQEFRAFDGNAGPLPFEKLDKQTWRIKKGEDQTIRLNYKVFANELTNINIASHIDETHAFFNGAAIFLYVVGSIENPVSLEIRKPSSWKIATGLEKTTDPCVYQAKDYNILIDCPTEIGTFTQVDFTAWQIPHHIIFYGLGDFDTRFLVPDFSKIVEVCAKLFGNLPYKEYLFLYHLTDRKRESGVEHANSAAMIFNQRDFLAKRNYERFILLTAHEYFHLWNIKHIKPKGWGPFDYTKEAYTKSHWFTEGITSYYADLILVRGGLWKRNDFYKDIASRVSEFETSPAKKMMSLTEASWNIWLSPDNARQTTISYYIKGAVVGLLLDLEIRSQTGNRKSLDDVLRFLNENYARSDIAYRDEELLSLINKISQSDLSLFFQKFISGTDDLPYKELLPYAGLELTVSQDKPVPDLGLEILKSENALAQVANIRPHSPAYEAGVDIGDVLVAVNEEQVTYDNWLDIFNRYKIGDTITLTYFHRNCLIKKQIGIAERQPVRYEIKESPSASTLQKEILKSIFWEK